MRQSALPCLLRLSEYTKIPIFESLFSAYQVRLSKSKPSSSCCTLQATTSQYGCSPHRDYPSAEGALPNSSTFGGNFLARSPFCGLRPGALLTKNRHRMPTVSTLLGKNGDEELSVFCVAAILVQNRNKLLKEVQSMDDAIKMFNDMNLTIRVHSSMHTAIKLRKKYRSRVRSSTIGAKFSLQ
ncbi:hypothetical protein MPTK2_4g90330P [Marchantia polymorpha subsp. ruderalis]